MCEHTMSDKIRNETIHEKLEAPVVDKIRKARLRWFEHVQIRSTDAHEVEVDLKSIVGRWSNKSHRVHDLR